MKNQTGKSAIQGIGAIAIMLSTQSVFAADWDFSGFIRQEGAYKLGSGDENYWNQGGNVYNGKPELNFVNELLGLTPVEVTRPKALKEDNDWNMMITRAEFDIDAKFSDSLKMFIKVRGIYQYDVYDQFGDANHFETPFRGDCATRLEVCGDDYMIDLPSFYFDYSKGPFWLRIGNQQIAWGESLFFRVLDTPNGLDLRRHSVVDWASEEFSDKRVPALGLRGSYQFNNGWELEGFAQEFQPTIYSNENTPYNLIGSQFVVQQEDGFDEVDDEWNFGLRLRGDIGGLGLQFTATSRRNPDGVFRWTKSNVNPFTKNGLPDPVLAPGVTLGGLLSETPFEPFSGQGVYGATEWYDYSGRSRLNGTSGLQSTFDDFPAAAAIAQPVLDAFGIDRVQTYDQAILVLDSFFSTAAGGLGDLRGHLDRRYKREQIYGFGMNYMFFGEPDSLTDQLMVRFEATITPNKVFTAPDLGKDYIEEDEWVTSVVLEKYQRFSQNFPATFMVLQWMHKSESDLAGRHLDGYGGNPHKEATGRNGFDAFSFAFQQPFPNLIWRADFAFLWDPKGGYLVQPALRWKPREAWTAEVFANFIGGDDDNRNTLSSFDWADEVAFRLTYQF